MMGIRAKGVAWSDEESSSDARFEERIDSTLSEGSAIARLGGDIYKEERAPLRWRDVETSRHRSSDFFIFDRRL